MGGMRSEASRYIKAKTRQKVSMTLHSCGGEAAARITGGRLGGVGMEWREANVEDTLKK